MTIVTECTPFARASDQAVDRQLAAWRRLRGDHRLRREQLADLQRRRAGRPDLVQFDVLPDGEGSEVLAVRGELLVRAADLGSAAVAALVAGWGLRAVPVAELDGRVVRLVGPAEPGRVAALLADAAARGLPVAASHLTPMGGIVMKGGTAPTPAATGRRFPGGTGAGPVVAVLDTGVAARPRTDGWLAGVGGPDDVDPLDAIGGDGELDPGAGHGTFAAGIVQQVAPDAQVRAYRVMDSAGLGSEVAVAGAMVRAAEDGAAVINLSLGTQTIGDRPPVALEAAMELLAERHPDVLVVAAAGNDGDTRPCWPAAFPDVVSVAGLDADLRPGDWSNRGDWVTCSTVGEDVVSTYVTGRHGEHEFGPDAWASWTGTSFAAPQVAGAVAGRCAAEPGTTPRAALAGLLAGGHDVPGHGRALPVR
jgi:Subtilase family